MSVCAIQPLKFNYLLVASRLLATAIAVPLLYAFHFWVPIAFHHRNAISSPKHLTRLHCISIKQIAACVELYQDILPNPQHVSSEMTVWQKKWRNVNQGDRPCSAMEACLACNGHGAFFPDLKILLRAFATLPVSAATAEISFSTMKRIKPRIRKTSQ